MSTVESDEARLLAVMLRAVDRHDLPVTRRQVEVLAVEVAAWLVSRERPAEGRKPVVRRHRDRRGWLDGPSVEQVDCLVWKTRSRALSGAEVERLAAGVARLRLLVGFEGPVRWPCSRCGAGVGVACRSSGSRWTRPHRERVDLWLAS